MFIRGAGTAGEVVVRFSGFLDASNARDVRVFLDGVGQPEIVVDLSQAAGIDNYGLMVLVQELVSSGCEIKLQGVGRRQVRMIRYLGVDPARLGLGHSSEER